MTKSRVFLYFCLAFVGGIFINSFVFIPQLVMLGFLVLGIFLISVLWQRKKLAVVGFCLLFLVLGIWRHQAALSKIIYPEEQSIVFTAKAVKEPDIRVDNIKLTVESEDVPGRVLLTVGRYPEYQYGDELKISGKLQTPHEFEDFNYQDYLAKDGIYSVMYWPEIEKIGENNGFTTSIMRGILGFKDKLRKSIYKNMSPPHSSLLGAMILGDKSRLPADLKERLNKTGVRHITAISGIHIMILSGILMSLGAWLGLRGIKTFYLAVSLLTLYIIMVGLPSSAVRAGIMGGLWILAKALGRQRGSVRPIVFAAALMLVQNPLLLRWDIGFQLSFLAVLGMVYLMPELKRWVKLDILAMTLSAQVFTLPILIYNFGYFSLAGLVTNILIVPLLAYVLGFGFIFGLAGIFSQTLGWILSWPCWLLLTYIVKIIDWFSKTPSVTM